MLKEEIQSSVYFAHEDSELLQIYQHIGKATTSDQAGSAVEGGLSDIVLFKFGSSVGIRVSRSLAAVLRSIYSKSRV